MYLLVIIDAFTKFINIRAVRDTKSITAIKVFKEHFSYFGVPSRLITITIVVLVLQAQNLKIVQIN